MLNMVLYDFILNPYWKVTIQKYIEAYLNDLSYSLACGFGLVAVIILIFVALAGFVDIDELNEGGM